MRLRINGGFSRGRRCISEIADEKVLSGRRKLFFSVLPAIFVQSCAQGVTDLWPVCGTANHLFLNARKMHSLPSKRNREIEEREEGKWANEFYYTVMARKKKRTNGRGLKKKGCFVRRRYS